MTILFDRWGWLDVYAKPNRFIKIKPNSGSAKLTVSTVVLHHQNSRLQLGPDTDALWLAKLMKALA